MTTKNQKSIIDSPSKKERVIQNNTTDRQQITRKQNKRTKEQKRITK